jgi:hypothetical protein
MIGLGPITFKIQCIRKGVKLIGSNLFNHVIKSFSMLNSGHGHGMNYQAYTCLQNRGGKLTNFSERRSRVVGTADSYSVGLNPETVYPVLDFS